MSTLEQSRYLATAIPGPVSAELLARKSAAVARGVGTTMPIYAARAFGGIVVRAAYRSPGVNDFCHQRNKPGDFAYFCSDNVYGAARHIWDLRDADGHMGATASVFVPWYLERYVETGDFRPLAWWIVDHISDYAEAIFYPWLCAFNIRWYEVPSDKAIKYDSPEQREDIVLTRRGMDGFDGDHADQYPGFPAAG